MAENSTLKPISAIRWLVAFASGLVCASLLMSSSLQSLGELSHIFCLVAIALVAYSWVLYSMAMSIGISAITFLCVVWVCALQRSVLLGVDLLALTFLLGIGFWQMRRRFRRFQRMSQVLDDLREETTVKEQAVSHATQLRDALQKKLYRYTQLQAIAERLSYLTEFNGIAQLAVESAFSLIGKSDACLLLLLDTHHQELSLIASKKHDGSMAIRAKHGDPFDRYVLRTHRPLIVSDVRRDFRFTTMGFSDRCVSSVIACPILLNQGVAGVLRLDSAQPAVYSQDDLRFLDVLLGLVETAMANAQLFEKTQQLAITDGLTGLLLARPLSEQLGRELVRADRNHEPISVLMLDIDHFKQYNDKYGHPAGDGVLKRVADILRRVVPPDAAVARYGGEEFIILLPRMIREEARVVAESIRFQVAEQALRPESGMRIKITLSIGIVCFPEDARTEVELIRVADQRLYQAKHDGRNRVCAL